MLRRLRNGTIYTCSLCGSGRTIPHAHFPYVGDLEVWVTSDAGRTSGNLAGVQALSFSHSNRLMTLGTPHYCNTDRIEISLSDLWPQENSQTPAILTVLNIPLSHLWPERPP